MKACQQGVAKREALIKVDDKEENNWRMANQRGKVIYRVIQRNVPPSTAKLGNTVKNPRAYLKNIGKNTLFAKKSRF